jgi:AsmA protein
VRGLDAAATGFVDEASGIRRFIDFAGQLTSDGTLMTTKGKATATQVQLLPGGAPAGVPVVVDYGSSYNSRTQRGTLTQGEVHVGAATARLTGNYDASGKSTVLRMRLVGQKIPVTALEAVLPAVGVTLPAGAALTQGTMDTDLAIGGPVDHLVITGPLGISNATLTGFDLTGKLGALASFAGLPKTSDTVIETLAARLRVAPEGVTAEALDLTVPTIGTLTGGGTISPNETMDFKMLARLRRGPAPAVTGVAAVVSFSQKEGIPFRIGGTTSKPAFAPDLGSVATNVKGGLAAAAKNPDTLEKAGKALGSLLNRKK